MFESLKKKWFASPEKIRPEQTTQMPTAPSSEPADHVSALKKQVLAARALEILPRFLPRTALMIACRAVC